MDTETLDSSLIFSIETLPLPASSEDILRLLRLVLSKPYVQKIILQSDKDIEISWYRASSDSITEESYDEAVEATLDRIILEELDGSDDIPEFSPDLTKKSIFECMQEISLKGLQPTHIVCNSAEHFKKLLGLPRFVNFPKIETLPYLAYLGLSLVSTPHVLENTLVVCGAPIRSDFLSSVTYGLKISFDIKEN